MNQPDYHQTRIPYLEKRRRLWETLWSAHFSRIIKPDFHVVELGAGYCDFINAVHCRRRTAIDLWEEMPDYAAAGVEFVVGDVLNLDFLPAKSVDLFFASNLLEHLEHEDVGKLLTQIRAKLKEGGELILIQPNYKYAFREYFDDFTHRSIFTDISLCDLLRVNGFQVVDCRARFLPLTLKSRFPVLPFLIRLYLALPCKTPGKADVHPRPVSEISRLTPYWG